MCGTERLFLGAVNMWEKDKEYSSAEELGENLRTLGKTCPQQRKRPENQALGLQECGSLHTGVANSPVASYPVIVSGYLSVLTWN